MGVLNGDGNSSALAVGLMKLSGLGPHVGAVFNAPSTVNFGNATLRASDGPSTKALIFTSSVEWNVATATLPTGDDLDLGLVSGTASGSFSSLTFKVIEQGTTELSQTFSTVTAANAFFTDDLRDLGAWINDGSGALDVLATLSETLNGSGNGYAANFLVGVGQSTGGDALLSPRAAAVPEPAGFWLFVPGIFGLGLGRLRGSITKSAKRPA